MIIAFEDKTPDLADDVYVAPTAAVVGDVVIGAGSSVWFGTVIRGDYGPIRIGAGCSIQDNAVIHVNHTSDAIFPTVIEDDCIVGHGAVVEGCIIGRGCLVGMNAIVLPRATVGEGCVIAAGAVIKEGMTVPAYSLLAGAPAVVKRTFDGPSEALAWAAGEYRELAGRYRRGTRIISEI
jgi:carbonic anhydrase/acetyltransferase-like protein (isoleucine patch superfamily)